MSTSPEALVSHPDHSETPVLKRGARLQRKRSITLKALLLVLVLLQRLAVPVGAQQASVGLLVFISVCVWACVRGYFQIDVARARFYCLTLLTLLCLTLLAEFRSNSPSIFSVLLVAAIYVPIMFRVPLAAADLKSVHVFFVRLMGAMSVVGLVQFSSVYAGIGHEDWLARIVPMGYLLGGYNTGNPVVYGSPLYRANGVLFLEPSFLSFFLGLAVLVAVYHGLSGGWLILLLVGIVPTLAGNGLVVLLVGCCALLASSRRRFLGRLAVPMVGALVVAAATPLGDLFIQRSTEASSSGSSSSLRFVQPYQRLLPAYCQHAVDILVGRGAGSITNYIRSLGSSALIAPTIPKLLFEYGGIGAVVFLALLAHGLFCSPVRAPWVPALAFAFLFLNAALLQPTLALTTIYFGVTARVTSRPCSA